MLKPTTPAGHPLLSAVWLAAAFLLLAAAGLLLARSFLWPAAALLGTLGLVAGWVAYLVRHRRHRARLAEADRLQRAGELGAAREILRPLLAAFPASPDVQRASGLLLYAAGDPLSATALLESAMRGAGPDPIAVTTLVAAYAAMNKAGDARRAARVLPNDPDVRLALAWSELVALGGERSAGAAIVSGLVHDPAARATVTRRVMLGALVAIAEALAGRIDRMRASLSAVEAAGPELVAADRAFVSYLGAIALRESGDIAGARRTFDAAMGADAECIGAALARRERSHLPSAATGP